MGVFGISTTEAYARLGRLFMVIESMLSCDSVAIQIVCERPITDRYFFAAKQHP